MKRVITVGTVVLGLTWWAAAASQSRVQANGSHADHSQQPNAPMAADGAHAHGPSVPAITYAELQQTTAQLAAARTATAKYQDVRAAEADGYHAIGPNVPGMGIHYVRQGASTPFSIEEPPILLYEKDATTAGLRLVGVSYLVVAPSGADGQPATSPFPKALASWHKHNNVCVLRTTVRLSSLLRRNARGVAVASRRKRAGWCTHGSGRTVPRASSVRRTPP